MAFAPDRDAEARLAAELAAERAPAPMGSAGITTGPRILRVEPFGGRDAARVVVTLDRPAQHSVDDGPGEGTGGPRTVVELFGVEAGAHAARGVADGILAAWAVEATTRGARLVLDLDGPGSRRVFPLQEPYRLVVDVARTPPGVASPRRVRRIALDPGHGGADPGAVGPRGLREKDVALDNAHRAAPVLAREGLEVLLTRDDDRTVSLEERTARANAFAADLLLSIHCNSADNPRRRGVETYVLDTASDVVANRVAARENAASPGATAELGGILASLRIASHASHSRTLAELLQRAALASLSPYREVHDGGVHPAGFYVLLGARMPGALFETSYLSHPEEEERLRTEAYRQRLADAIVNAVAAYRQGR
jgi:N-acetylmuramoyl-L-alanine amidase